MIKMMYGTAFASINFVPPDSIFFQMISIFEVSLGNSILLGSIRLAHSRLSPKKEPSFWSRASPPFDGGTPLVGS